MDRDFYLTQIDHQEVPPPAAHNRTLPQGLLSKYFPQLEQGQPRLLWKLMEDTYYESKKLKPGITLFKTIVETEEKRKKFKSTIRPLRLRFPQTYLIYDNSAVLLTTQDEIVKATNDITFPNFIKMLPVPDDPNLPIAVQCSPNDIQIDRSLLLAEQVCAKLAPRSETIFLQRYIVPYGLYPNVQRIFYYPNSTRATRKSYGYKLTNFKSITDRSFKKHRVAQTYYVDTEKPATYQAVLLKGKALVPCLQMASSLCEYLNQSMNVRISELVLDFVVAEDKVPYFLEIRSVCSNNLDGIWHLGNEAEIRELTDNFINQVQCKLCGLTYRRHDATKLVTNKLILELLEHLARRGQLLTGTPLLQREGKSILCNLCFDLVVAEDNLVEVEKQFRLLLNIKPTPTSPPNIHNQPKLTVDKLLNIEDMEDPTLKVGFKKWKMFVFFGNLRGSPQDLLSSDPFIALQMRFLSQRHLFKKKTSLQTVTKGRRLPQEDRQRNLMGKLNEHDKSTMHTEPSHISFSDPQIIHLPILKAKVLEFYSKTTQTGLLLPDINLEINLNLAGHKFKGRSLILHSFRNVNICQRSGMEIYLFDQDMVYCSLQLTLGLYCSEQVSKLPAGVSPDGTLYFLHSQNSACEPLPDEWMEIIEKKATVPQQLRVKHSQTLSVSKLKLNLSSL